jgi:hypothetical protein
VSRLCVSACGGAGVRVGRCRLGRCQARGVDRSGRWVVPGGCVPWRCRWLLRHRRRWCPRVRRSPQRPLVCRGAVSACSIGLRLLTRPGQLRRDVQASHAPPTITPSAPDTTEPTASSMTPSTSKVDEPSRCSIVTQFTVTPCPSMAEPMGAEHRARQRRDPCGGIAASAGPRGAGAHGVPAYGHHGASMTRARVAASARTTRIAAVSTIKTAAAHAANAVVVAHPGSGRK